MNAWMGNRPPMICLLGECRLGSREQSIRLTYRKGWALLAYLAMERSRSHRRSSIAALLWPELAHGAALTNLRQVLTDLNRAMSRGVGKGVLLVDRETVRLCPNASRGLLDIDLLDSAGADAWLLETGELLDGMQLEGCEDFGEWLLGARSWASQRLRSALEHGRDDALAAGDTELALRLARRQVAMDGWDEAAQRGLMQVYLQMGRPAAALECYRVLEDLLRRELDVEPQAQTRALVEEIRQQGASVPPPYMPVARPGRQWRRAAA